MPTLSLLLLPLLGGFVFATRFYPTSYLVKRSDGHRLYFLSAITGVVLLVVATAILAEFQIYKESDRVLYEWKRYVPFEHGGKTTLAFLMGLTLWWPLNLILGWIGSHKWFSALGRDAAYRRAVNEKRDPLELMILAAVDREATLAFNIKNGKVYIGTVTDNFNPVFQKESVGVSLRYSGHREEDTLRLSIDVDYVEARRFAEDQEFERAINDRLQELSAEYIEEQQGNPEQIASDAESYAQEQIGAELDDIIDKTRKAVIDRYIITIPMSEIQSVNFFSYDEYERHFKAKQGPSLPTG